MNKPIIILAIESSCDDTSASICVDGKILSNVIATQSVHEQYGGVVPELASRAHIQNIVPVIDKAIHDAELLIKNLKLKIKKSQFITHNSPLTPHDSRLTTHDSRLTPHDSRLTPHDSRLTTHDSRLTSHDSRLTPHDSPFTTHDSRLTLHDIDAIAFTQAPGLIGSLLVGACFAKSLALALDKPLIAVHHMQAHVMANLIGENKPDFPFLCLTVSGGHTQIVVCRSPNDMEVIGQTLDDAAGEAFDKSAKILGLPYPGGPLIDKYAKEGNPIFNFKEPQIPELNFSFSGLKTSILYFLQKEVRLNENFIKENLADLCASIQARIVSILLNKLKLAAKETGIKTICLAGGVSANSGLRNGFTELGKSLRWKTFIPAFEYCTDNAAMIAITGYHKYLNNDFVGLEISPTPKAEW